MKSKLTLCVIFILAFNALHGQNKISGTVLNKESNLPIGYVNIGVAGKDIGTVSDKDGKFNLLIEPQYINDSLLFSCIGFESLSVNIKDITENHIISLNEKSYSLSEVIVKPRIFRERILGITTKSRALHAGFRNNNLGYECGLLMKNKKKAVIKSVTFNIVECTYDTLFYRLNIYEAQGKNNFVNVLTEAIYVTIPVKGINVKNLTIDLNKQNIIVNGDFLITLEHIRDLGDNGLYFSASIKQKTYYRKTSQGNWQTAPIGISLSVVADVEK